MNKKQRKLVEVMITTLEDICRDVENIMEEEQEKLDNLPEGLAETEMADNISNAIDMLDEVIDNLDGAIDNLSELKQ